MSEFENQQENNAPEQNADAAASKPGKKSGGKLRVIVELALLLVAIVAVCVVGEVKQLQWWCSFRARLGSVEMQYKLGESYAASLKPEDKAKAKYWLSQAAKNGHRDAALKAMDLTDDPAEKIEFLRRAAEKDPALQYQMGIIYRREGKSAEAVEWYTKAADGGLPEAQHALAGCYRDGEGVKKDLAKAKELYEKAAKQGYGPSQGVLENMK